MNKTDAIRKRAEWLAYCLKIGFSNDDLESLEKTWDDYYDENGNRRPPSPKPVNQTAEQILDKHTGCYEAYTGEETRNMVAAMEEYSSLQNKELRERVERLESGLRTIIDLLPELETMAVSTAKQLLNR